MRVIRVVGIVLVFGLLWSASHSQAAPSAVALGPTGVVTELGPGGLVLPGPVSLANPLGVTSFELVNGEFWGVNGSNAMRRWAADGTLLSTSGLWDNATDLEVVGNEVWAMGPANTLSKLFPTGQVKPGPISLQAPLSNLGNFEIVNGEIWGVNGSNAMRRWATDGTFLSTSGLWDTATDLEVVGNEVWALGPSNTLSKLFFTGQVKPGPISLQVPLSNLEDFEVINGEIWGVNGSNAMRRWAADGSFISTSGLWGAATDLTPGQTAIPEPATLALFAFGLVGLGTMRRRAKV